MTAEGRRLAQDDVLERPIGSGIGNGIGIGYRYNAQHEEKQ